MSEKKSLSKSFVDNHEDISEDAAGEMIVQSTQKIRGIEQERDADEQLTAGKQIVKDISSAYTSAIKYERAKINFLLEKIQEIQDGEVNPSSGVKL
jgi:hypothetical protein